MHLIRYCSVSGNKCGRLSDLVPSHHVSSGALLCQPVCLRLSSPPPFTSLSLRLCSAFPPASSPVPVLSTPAFSLSMAILISFPLLSTLIIPLSSQQITTLSISFLSLSPNCLSSSAPHFYLSTLFAPSFLLFFVFTQLCFLSLPHSYCGVTSSHVSGSASVGESGL